jgi:hypothetical protein
MMPKRRRMVVAVSAGAQAMTRMKACRKSQAFIWRR